MCSTLHRLYARFYLFDDGDDRVRIAVGGSGGVEHITNLLHADDLEIGQRK